MKYKRKTSYDIKEDYVLNLLVDRGILKDKEDTQWYFYPTEDNYCDPLKLDHMEEGYNLLKTHLLNGSKILLIVD